MPPPIAWLVGILVMMGPWAHLPSQAREGPGQADRDGDGIANAQDKCPSTPEDLDGFADRDGCPDPDNDSDGVVDTDDKCPMLPEDKDGFADEDGCPDPDNDQDGVPDRLDECPQVPGSGQGAGCPLAADAHQPLVLVFDVRDPAGSTNRKTLGAMADRLSARFAKLAGYRQIPRHKLHLVLMDDKTDTYRACWEPRCQRYLGERLAAHKVIGSSLERNGITCALRADLTDVAGGRVERSATVQGPCTPEGLLLTAQRVAEKLGAGS